MPATSASDMAFCFLASVWSSMGLSIVRAALLRESFGLLKLPAENRPAISLQVFMDGVIPK